MDLRQSIDGCLRHGLGGIGPWRDIIHDVGVDSAASMLRDSGLVVSGLCRGGWFTAEGALTEAVLDDNKRAVDEALAIGSQCLVMCRFLGRADARAVTLGGWPASEKRQCTKSRDVGLR